jgi:hypothetical protein
MAAVLEEINAQPPRMSCLVNSTVQYIWPVLLHWLLPNTIPRNITLVQYKSATKLGPHTNAVMHFVHYHTDYEYFKIFI